MGLSRHMGRCLLSLNALTVSPDDISKQESQIGMTGFLKA